MKIQSWELRGRKRKECVEVERERKRWNVGGLLGVLLIREQKGKNEKAK